MYWNLTDEERLLEAFTIAKNQSNLQELLQDLLTKEEIDTCVKRLKVACLLYEGASYKQIQSETKLAPATISRISKSLRNKDGGFYKIIKKFASQGESYFE